MLRCSTHASVRLFDRVESWGSLQKNITFINDHAVKSLFKFGTTVVSAWPGHSEFFARTATNFIGMNHLLQLGSGTLEGKLARALKESTLQGGLAKARDELVANPGNPKFLTMFYAARRDQADEWNAGQEAPAGCSSEFQDMCIHYSGSFVKRIATLKTAARNKESIVDELENFQEESVEASRIVGVASSAKGAWALQGRCCGGHGRVAKGKILQLREKGPVENISFGCK